MHQNVFNRRLPSQSFKRQHKSIYFSAHVCGPGCFSCDCVYLYLEFRISFSLFALPVVLSFCRPISMPVRWLLSAEQPNFRFCLSIAHNCKAHRGPPRSTSHPASLSLYLCVTELEHMRPRPKLQCSALGCGLHITSQTHTEIHSHSSDAEKRISHHRDWEITLGRDMSEIY